VKRKRILGRIAAVAVCAAILLPSVATAASVSVTKIASNGFGDRQNSYAWSMAWFKDNLYVGTVRNMLCLEGATVDFYYPNLGYYKTQPEPEMTCPADRYQLDLRAEIWRFTPGTSTWSRVYQSPADIANPRSPGRTVARDVGFRGMAVLREPDGTETLYVGGVSANEIIPELKESNPPRILRTTDGVSFTPLGGSPGIVNTAFGPVRAMGYRAMVVHNGRLFVTASNSLTGDGVVLEVKNPSSPVPTYVQVSPQNLQVYEIDTFNGSLYIGVGDGIDNSGYSVWRATASGSATPFSFTPVITQGAGRGSAITSVVAMKVFNNRLYVGSAGWYNSVFPSSELVRINPDDSWDVVAGIGRLTPQGFKFPISGQGDGFDNPFNAHFWRIDRLSGGLQLTTNDWSWSFRNVPVVNLLLGRQFGFDLFGSCDGRYWSMTTQNAFGEGRFNFGGRTMAASPTGGFVGSANHVQGASVWRSSNLAQCAASTSATSATSADSGTSGPLPSVRVAASQIPVPPGVSTVAGALVASSEELARPGRLLTEPQACGTVLSWDASPGAARYNVLRTEYVPAKIRLAPPPPLWGPDLTGGDPRPAAPGDPPTTETQISVPGPETMIATTAGTSFVDRTARPGGRYRYVVAAASRGRRTSPPSNTATVPSLREPDNFTNAQAAVGAVARRGKLVPGAEARLVRALTDANARFAANDVAQAGLVLDEIQARVSLDSARGGEVGDPLAREDLSDTVLRLQRSIKLSGSCAGSR